MKEINAGIIGFGNMGAALYERLKRVCSLQVYDKEIARTFGVPSVDVARTFDDLLKKSDVIILAVKPQDFEEVIKHVKFDVQEKLVISIAAGTTTGFIEQRLGDVQVVRVMPNIAAKIGKGMSCLCKGKTATDWNLSLADLATSRKVNIGRWFGVMLSWWQQDLFSGLIIPLWGC